MFTTSLVVSALAAGSFSTLAFANATNYSLVADFSGSSFFDGFNTFTGADPTNGHVNYTDMAFAAQEKLLGFIYHDDSNATNAYVGVDHTNIAPVGRNSVRLTSKQRFNPGMLAAFDILHIPSGPGYWPALWWLGNVGDGIWPANGGEADIFEWVHDTGFNSMTLHTAPGCTVDNSTELFLGNLQNASCNAGSGSDGCSIHAPATSGPNLATAGAAFNQQGGAVYVQEWTDFGISIWIFARNATPTDLHSGKPDTYIWPKPLANFAGSGCSLSNSLQDMNLIINTDLCGDWAAKVWESSGMATHTGVATCNDYVANIPKAFVDGYWEFASIRIYSNHTSPGYGLPKKREVSGIQFSEVRRHNASGCLNGTESTTSHGDHLHSDYLNSTLGQPHNYMRTHNYTYYQPSQSNYTSRAVNTTNNGVSRYWNNIGLGGGFAASPNPVYSSQATTLTVRKQIIASSAWAPTAYGVAAIVGFMVAAIV